MHSQLIHDLKVINYPEQNWVEPSPSQLDIAIIGAGMAGLSAAFALTRLGILNICLFDKADAGLEGPWDTCARMPTLRSTKELVGPAMDIAALTFRAWYENLFGEAKWEELGKIPTLMWMQYLRWYREVLHISVKNNHSLTAIEAHKNGLKLKINNKIITAKKVVLATGRAGFGGCKLPDFVEHLPKSAYAHTDEIIDFKALQGKKIGIVGAGAAGFDAAAKALENNAKSVDILLRRPHLPNVNKPASLCYSGFSEGYYNLADDIKCALMFECYKEGVPPPIEALERMDHFSHFSVRRKVDIQKVEYAEGQVALSTKKEVFSFDFLILATGYAIDGARQLELAPLIKDILLWEDRGLKNSNELDWFALSPYLGPHFQFLEKIPGSVPFLKDIYCFNYASTLSHGLLGGDIPGIGIGAMRLAQGIASDFFTEGAGHYAERLQNYQTEEFNEQDFTFFKD